MNYLGMDGLIYTFDGQRNRWIVASPAYFAHLVRLYSWLNGGALSVPVFLERIEEVLDRCEALGRAASHKAREGKSVVRKVSPEFCI